MKYFYYLSYSMLLGFCNVLLSQQIIVDNTISPQNLIENTLVQGCVEISNISSPINGSSFGFGSFGYFERGSSEFPFSNGIVLTTGDANAGGNGENLQILNDGSTSWQTDADLESALGISGTLNATSIEFNFTSISNFIQFNYILASEEYFANFPCDYSDGFAFLIREAGSTEPFTNIALITGTNTPVNTTTIHPEIPGFCAASNIEFFDGYNMGDTNYNGRTTVLSASANIQPNVEYEIKLVIADQTDINYDSAVFIEGNSFNIAVDFGEDITTCNSEVLLNADIGNPSAIYNWFFNDVLLPTETSSTLNTTLSGTYNVSIDIPLAGRVCEITDEIIIVLNSPQQMDPPSDYEVCVDSSSNGIATFDLTTKNNEVISTLPPANYDISYYYSSAAALSGQDAITSPIQNTENPQIIYTRTEDVTNGCLTFSTINIVVNPTPIITDPTPLVVCDDNISDGFTAIYLTEKNDEIANGQDNLIIKYHATLENAQNGQSPFSIPYTNTSRNQQVFVSATNPQTGCISTTTLDITVLSSPLINTDEHFINACDQDLDGFSEFDLTLIIPDVLEGLTGVTVTFYETLDDANLGINAITNETSYQNTVIDLQIIFIRVVLDITGCTVVLPIKLYANFNLSSTTIFDFLICDTDNDNTEVIDLEPILSNVFNNSADTNIYISEDDRDNEINPVDVTAPFLMQSTTKTFYTRLATTDCAINREIVLSLIPITEFPPITAPVSVCDEDQNAITTIDLSAFDSFVTGGLEDFSVSYFANEEDAINNVNVLPNFYTNTTPIFTLYPRIQENINGCADVISVDFNVLVAPELNDSEPLIVCDYDRDGFSVVDLSSLVSDAILNASNRIFSFHNSESDAAANNDPITDFTNYNAQTETVFVRIEDTENGCFSVSALTIIVEKLPFVGSLTNFVVSYVFCEDNTSGFGEFIFETKDEEALASQTGKIVSYYENPEDAENGTSPIDKTAVYENISNPQTIYVRVENITDSNCYDTSTLVIEVGTTPLFNAPTEWRVCDDISNDGSEIFDLSLKIDEISNNISETQNITFYTSETDAKNSTNAIPLQFSNTTNPQRIFFQVDNGNICKAISSLILTVIQVPEVNLIDPIQRCDDNYDGILNWDITSFELDILNVRQNNLELSYFRTLEDLESENNPILNPSNFTNTTNPQTVYLKAQNTVSGCFATIPIEFVVNLPPPINDFEFIEICDNPISSFSFFNVNEIIVEDPTDVVFSYHNTLEDAESNSNALNTNYTYTSINTTFYSRVSYGSTGCHITYPFELRVNDIPLATQPDDIIVCDDDFDGFYDFNLQQQTNDILNGLSTTEFTVTYYNNNSNAATRTNAIDALIYRGSNNEIITARLENNQTGCYSLVNFSLFVKPRPFVDIPDQVLCADNSSLIVSALASVATDTYLWSTNETTPEIEITEIGSYSVTVTRTNGCVTASTFNVTLSESATIELTEIVDFADPNNITITISGIGDYLYILDDGFPQESNVFENVSMGYHTVKVIDLNGCTEVTREVLVIDIPKFMTPNGDGAFDTWHIVGVETLPGTIVYIFDRYGKLLTTLTHDTPGWNGKHNGFNMPAADYWFLAEVKRGEDAFVVQGHFALKR